MCALLLSPLSSDKKQYRPTTLKMRRNSNCGNKLFTLWNPLFKSIVTADPGSIDQGYHEVIYGHHRSGKRRAPNMIKIFD